jgi:hypothetical protein
MKGLFIPEITAEMFRNGCLESIETLMAEGEIYDIDYQQPCEDCISREQTLKAFAEKCGGECACCEYNGSGYDNAENCKLIKSMPSVTPSRPRGKWIVEREEITTEDCFISYPHTKCSLCKVEVRFATNFCPCCGADMRKSEDKE